MIRRQLTLPLTAGLLSLGLLSLAPATTASAHSELLESSPASGAVLDKAPRDVELTFGEEVQSPGSGIVVKGPSGQRYDDPASFAVDSNVAMVDLQQGGLVDGRYTVSYRIVSADGHIVSGSYDFRLRGVAASDSSAPPTPALTSTLDTSPAAGSSDSGGSDGGVIWVLGLGAIGLVLVAAVISVAVRGRRGR